MNESSTAMLMVRMGLSLAIILGLIWGAARVVRRRGGAHGRSTTDVEVVARRSTGRRSNLLVVRIAGRTLLVGATENQVNLVADVTESFDPDVAMTVEPYLEPRPESETAASVGQAPVDLRQPPVPVEAAGVRRAPLLDTIRDFTVRRA
jgi:flagellar biosynthetic protein FliO